MQGYVLHTTKVRDEDLIVTILTSTELKQLYRFYGARHSPIQVGFKVDFEQESSPKSPLPRLRNVLGIPNRWMRHHERLYIWQQFCRLLHEHLRGITDLDACYFHILEQLSRKFSSQNPKRAILEGYVKILKHEGRLHDLKRCFFCENHIEESEISMARAFLPGHSSCIFGPTFPRASIHSLFQSEESLLLEDHTVEHLFRVVMEGF